MDIGLNDTSLLFFPFALHWAQVPFIFGPIQDAINGTSVYLQLIRNLLVGHALTVQLYDFHFLRLGKRQHFPSLILALILGQLCYEGLQILTMQMPVPG